MIDGDLQSGRQGLVFECRIWELIEYEYEWFLALLRLIGHIGKSARPAGERWGIGRKTEETGHFGCEVAQIEFVALLECGEVQRFLVGNKLVNQGCFADAAATIEYDHVELRASVKPFQHFEFVRACNEHVTAQ